MDFDLNLYIDRTMAARSYHSEPLTERTVVYHSREWDGMVENGWVTAWVEAKAGAVLAHMVRV